MSRYTNKLKSQANNAARGRVVSTALTPNGDDVVLVNGKRSPACNDLADTIGTKQTIEFLRSNGQAVSAYTLKNHGLLEKRGSGG